MYKRDVSSWGFPNRIPLTSFVRVAQPSGFTAGVMPEDYFIHFYRPDSVVRWRSNGRGCEGARWRQGEKGTTHHCLQPGERDLCALGGLRAWYCPSVLWGEGRVEKESRMSLNHIESFSGIWFDFRIFRLVPSPSVTLACFGTWKIAVNLSNRWQRLRYCVEKKIRFDCPKGSMKYKEIGEAHLIGKPFDLWQERRRHCGVGLYR